MYLVILDAMENTVSHMVSIESLNEFSVYLQWCLVRAAQAVDS